MIEFLEEEDEEDEENDDENEDGIYERFLDYLSGMYPPCPEIPEFTSKSVILMLAYLNCLNIFGKFKIINVKNCCTRKFQ